MRIELEAPVALDRMDERSVDLGAALRLVRRQIRLVLLCLLIGVTIAGAVIVAVRPVYTGTTLVLFDPSRKDLLNPDAQLPSFGWEDARIESELELVRTEPIMSRVVDDLGLVGYPEFAPTPRLRDRLAWLVGTGNSHPPTGQALRNAVARKAADAITVQRRGGTFLIAISARSQDPQTSAELANAVARTYIDQQLASKVEATQAARDTIERRIADAAAVLARSEETVDDFLATSITRVAEATGRDDLQTLQLELERANRASQEALGTLQQLEAGLREGEYGVVAQRLGSETLVALLGQKEALEAQLSVGEATSQEALELRRDLAELTSRLDATAGQELGSFRSEVSQRQTSVQQLRDELRKAILSTDLPADVLTGWYSLQQNAELTRTQHQALLARSSELTAQIYLQVADSRVVAAASAPANPSFPNPPLILGLATLLSLAGGVGLAFVVENYVGGFTAESQLSEVLRVPVLAAFPKTNDNATAAPLSQFSEAGRRLRFGVDQLVARTRGRAGPSRCTTVLVTSALPQEGKTTVALALARTYALSGAATLLIDADLRSPQVAEEAGIEQPSLGFLDCLGGGLNLDEVVVQEEGTGLALICGTQPAEVATDTFFSGASFARLLEHVRERFDVVILDTAPLEPVVDALYVAAQCDVAVLAVRWAKTPQGEARAALSALDEAKSVNAAVVAVLNQKPVRSGRTHRYARYR